MAVCACGQPMEIGEGWCKKCWTNWSVWFMRAGGRWINFERQAVIVVDPCNCAGCHITRHLIYQADIAEYRMTRR